MTKKKQTTDMDSYSIDVCKNCGETTKVRDVEAYGMFVRASRESSRGFYKICYRCFGPRVIWYKGRTEYRSPMNISDEDLEKFMTIKSDTKRRAGP